MTGYNPAHICWKPDDPDLPEDLQEVVGEWGLGVCKLCGRTEAQLEDRCIHELCPFCGSNPILRFMDGRGFNVQCEHRHENEDGLFNCPVNMRTHYYQTEEEAWTAWDTRNPIQKIREKIKSAIKKYNSIGLAESTFILENVEEMIK